MPESQNVEWKESWDDKYLEWVCGFANAQGGVIHIGKNDVGEVTGVKNSKVLLELIPTKIRNTMGIIADVGLLYENDMEYIEIKVKSYPFPVSCRGKYYYRSGSSKLEMTGAALDQFMLQKQGKTWDGVPIPYESVDTLKQDALKLFRKKALQSERLSDEALSVEDRILLENLRLYEGNYLKRAAILLFHEDPEKWVQGAYIKVGFFGKNDADLLYHDEIHGSLMEQVDKTLELVYQKYLKALISYKDVQRVETFMFPRSAFREILLNAVIHKLYESGIPIQISIYEDKMYVWNPGELPETLTIDMLFKKHPSIPRNPMIADTFFKTGMIESWGRGFEKIKMACKESKTVLPKYSVHVKGMMVLCKESSIYKKLRKELLVDSKEKGVADVTDVTDVTDANVTVNVTQNVTANEDDNKYDITLAKPVKKDTPTDRAKKIVEIFQEIPSTSIEEAAIKLNVTKRTVIRDIEKLKEQNLVMREGSDKNGRWIVKR